MSDGVSTQRLGPGQRVGVGAIVTIMLPFAGFPLLWISRTSIKPNSAIRSTDPFLPADAGTLDECAGDLGLSQILRQQPHHRGCHSGDRDGRLDHGGLCARALPNEGE